MIMLCRVFSISIYSIRVSNLRMLLTMFHFRLSRFFFNFSRFSQFLSKNVRFWRWYWSGGFPVFNSAMNMSWLWLNGGPLFEWKKSALFINPRDSSRKKLAKICTKFKKFIKSRVRIPQHQIPATFLFAFARNIKSVRFFSLNFYATTRLVPTTVSIGIPFLSATNAATPPQGSAWNFDHTGLQGQMKILSQIFQKNTCRETQLILIGP